MPLEDIEGTGLGLGLRTAFSLKEAWIQEIKDEGKVKVIEIPADINVSDMLTKVQPGTKVKRYIDLINPIKINRRRQEEVKV